MLPLWKVKEVRRLRAEGYSYRQIARLAEVAYATVVRILREPQLGGSAEGVSAAGPDEPAGPSVRCPECGYRVYLPCRICAAREARNRVQSRPTAGQPADDGESLRLSLRSDHEACYVEVRRRRRSQRGIPRREPAWPRRREEG